ncbi:MAG: LemA family protein [Candidatus Buchananbacteria bacterium]
MKNSSKWLIGIAIVVVIIAVWLVGAYNNFIKLDQEAQAQWAQVESQYQRRFDLIPNLVASVQGILKQEQAIFGMIAEARTRYAGAQGVENKVQAANQLESALSRLLVVMENYPTLKSNENVQTLMVQLEGTENRIAVERGRYNELVKIFNVSVTKFPSNVLARIFGFSAKGFFESTVGAEIAPQVKLN